MPYKSQEQARNYAKEAMKRKRKGITKQGITEKETTQNVIPEVELFEGKPRFLKLSDGQILDRANQPKPNKHLVGMAACNRANEADLSHGKSKQKRLAMIVVALSRTMTGLDGKPLRLSSIVRYGVSGPTFDEL